MGNSHNTGSFGDAAMKEQYSSIQTLWSEDDLAALINKLKDMTLNFSLDKIKFGKLLQLSVAFEERVGKWFTDFSHDRASGVVDGLEFLAASILVSSQVATFKKISLLFNLFDLDKTDCIRKDEFTIFLKASAAGLHRMVSGLPPPATVAELGTLSSDFFSSLSSEVLSQQDLLTWMTEAHFSLNYLSVLARLHNALFAWGRNERYQLGLHLEPKQQKIPTPILELEGRRIWVVASHESHSLFLTEDGQVWSSGLGFSGILGHGNLEDSKQPRLIEALVHTRVIDVAVGVRHSVAVSEKGQVFTWGSADMGQLGLGSPDDTEVHTWASDPRTGGQYVYVPTPTVVITLFGQRINVRKACCCNFSTMVLTDQGHAYTWGNNTDGQCGQGQRCPDHKLIYVDPHMQRTAMQALLTPRRLEIDVSFQRVAASGYHMLAVDSEKRVWSWGRGLWSALGHGDQRTQFEPKMIETLKYQSCHSISAGEVHSTALCSLYRLTITGANPSVDASPFSLLGLPTGRIDKHTAARKSTTPPNTELQLNAFASAPLMQVTMPYQYEMDEPILNPARYKVEDAQQSIILMDRGMWEGEWLKLEGVDFDFRVQMSESGAAIPPRTGATAQLMFGVEGKWEPSDCLDKICVIECPAHLSSKTSAEELAPTVLALALQVQQAQGFAFLFVLPQDVDLFMVEAGGSAPEALLLSEIPFGVMLYEHGAMLKKHVTKLVNARISQAPDGIPDDVKDWRECRNVYTGMTYFEHLSTGEKRKAPPQISPNNLATLLTIREDTFMPRLQAMIELKPKGIIICQQSWRPDVELIMLPDEILEDLDVPVVMVTFEAGEELKGVGTNGSQPWVTMEVQPYGGVFAWGNGTLGQLGLGGIENQSFLTAARNMLTGEPNLFASRPYYVAHLHEHQVTSVACGSSHTVAVTQQGEVFTWGAATGLGVPLEKPHSEVPMFVEQLEGLVRATKAFAGHGQSFVVAEMPHQPIV